MKYITKTKFILLILLASIILSPQAFASDKNVNLDLTSATTSLCPGNTEHILGHITNNGDEKDTYTLSSDNSWVTIVPDKITLNAGEISEFHVYITPFDIDAQPADYPIEITSIGSKSKDSELITLNLLRCHGVEIKPEKSADTLCLGDRNTYDIIITNHGIVTEVFDISSTSGTLSDTYISLDSEESKKISISVNSLTEKETIQIMAQSRKSYASNSETIELTGINCYNSKMHITPETKTLCLNENSMYTISVENLGTKDDTYTLNTDFGKLNVFSLNVPAGKTKTASLTVAPQEIGNYDININAKSIHSEMNSKVHLLAINCKGIAIITIPPEMTTCKGTTAKYMVTMKNTGNKEDVFTISSTRGTVNDKIITIGSGEIKNTYIEINTSDLDYTTYDFEVSAKSTIKDTAMGSLVVENCYSEELIVKDNMKSTCPGKDTVYEITVKNTGKNKDTYTLSIDKANGIFENETLNIDAFEEKTTLLNIRSNSNDIGEKEIKITSQSNHVSVTNAVKLAVMDKEACFGYTVNTNPQAIEAVETRGYLFVSSIKNTGLYDSDYKFSIDGPAWVSAAPETITIKSGKTDKTYVYAAPPFDTEKGIYEIILTVTNSDGLVKQNTLQFAFNKKLDNKTSAVKTDIIKSDESKKYTAKINDAEIYTIDSENIQIVTATYKTKDGIKKSFDIGFEIGSFILSIKDKRITDENPQVGEKTYNLVTDDTQYKITIDFLNVNTTSNNYEFAIKNIEVIENAELNMNDEIKTPDQNTNKNSTKIIYAIIIGIILIILILFGPEIIDLATKTKEDEEPTFGISGIGSKREATLKKEGIKSVEGLAESDAKNIASILGVSEAQAKKYINAAAKKVKAAKKEKLKTEESKKETEKPSAKKPEKDVKDEIKEILDNI